MAVEYLKRAAKTPETETGTARKVAADMIAEIARGGEQAVRDYARKLDQWDGDIVVTPAEIERRTREIPADVRRDIEFATAQVRKFALAQRASIREFDTGSPSGSHRRPATDSRQRRGLLRAHGPLCAHRIGVHEHRHREGGRACRR
jgi:sulfopropanediol 3-dehydrogenase